MRCDVGRLQAYRDDALPAAQKTAVEKHLEDCPKCREELAVLRRRGQEVATRLEVLEPSDAQSSDAAQALRRFQARVQPAAYARASVSPAWYQIWSRRFETMRRAFLAGHWRPAAIGLLALALLIGLFSFAPVRQAAADFLGVFRVRKFTAISIEPAQLERLQYAANLLESSLFGEPVLTRQPGEPQTVTDAGQASALAGFRVRVPAELPAGASRLEFGVQAGPAGRWEVELAAVRDLLEAAGVTEITLPAVDRVTIEADIPVVVWQHYRFDASTVSIFQMPSPSATVSPDVDVAALGEALFRFLGMSPSEARRLARSIDWTSTLVIPLPSNMASFREVEIDGTTGLFLEGHEVQQPAGLILWERDEIIYGVSGMNVDSVLLLKIASSLQ